MRSLTTIATPHRGSAFADFIVEDLIGSARVTALLGVLASVGVKAGAFDDLTTTKMRRFNAETPDDPRVKYFSYGAEFTPSWSNAFRMSWGIMHEREGTSPAGLFAVERRATDGLAPRCKRRASLGRVVQVGRVQGDAYEREPSVRPLELPLFLARARS